jgi:hypothetical protein
MSQMATSAELPFERLMELMRQCQSLDRQIEQEEGIRDQIDSEVQQLEIRLFELKQKLFHQNNNIKALSLQWETLDDEITNTMAVHLEQRRARKAKLKKFPINEQIGNTPVTQFTSMGSPTMSQQSMGMPTMPSTSLGQNLTMGSPPQATFSGAPPVSNEYQYSSMPVMSHGPTNPEDPAKNENQNPFLPGGKPMIRESQQQINKDVSTQKPESNQNTEHTKLNSQQGVEIGSREHPLPRAVNDGGNPFAQWKPVGQY